jgi:hypothetical protein
MFYDALFLFQAQNIFSRSAKQRRPTSAGWLDQIAPRIEVVVGRWYLDEFGK